MTTLLSDFESSKLQNPYVIYLMEIIKSIQNLIHTTDLADKSYQTVYNTLSKKFNDFFENYPIICEKVIRNENLDAVYSVLYYQELDYVTKKEHRL